MKLGFREIQFFVIEFVSDLMCDDFDYGIFARMDHGADIWIDFIFAYRFPNAKLRIFFRQVTLHCLIRTMKKGIFDRLF